MSKKERPPTNEELMRQFEQIPALDEEDPQEERRGKQRGAIMEELARRGISIDSLGSRSQTYWVTETELLGPTEQPDTPRDKGLKARAKRLFGGGG